MKYHRRRTPPQKNRPTRIGGQVGRVTSSFITPPQRMNSLWLRLFNHKYPPKQLAELPAKG